MNRVLVAYPASFFSYSKFARKLGNILASLRNYEFFYLDDDNEFISRFSSQIAHTHEKKIVPEELTIVPTHAIVFDDGESFSGVVQKVKEARLPLRRIQVEITKVVNKDKNEAYDVYIGRGTPWGNPYAVGFGNSPDEEPDDRLEAIRKFEYDFERGYLKGGAAFKQNLLLLKGKRLGCHCKPLPCHGDILAKFLNAYDDGR